MSANVLAKTGLITCICEYLVPGTYLQLSSAFLAGIDPVSMKREHPVYLSVSQPRKVPSSVVPPGAASGEHPGRKPSIHMARLEPCPSPHKDRLTQTKPVPKATLI